MVGHFGTGAPWVLRAREQVNLLLLTTGDADDDDIDTGSTSDNNNRIDTTRVPVHTTTTLEKSTTTFTMARLYGFFNQHRREFRTLQHYAEKGEQNETILEQAADPDPDVFFQFVALFGGTKQGSGTGPAATKTSSSRNEERRRERVINYFRHFFEHWYASFAVCALLLLPIAERLGMVNLMIPLAFRSRVRITRNIAYLSSSRSSILYNIHFQY